MERQKERLAIKRTIIQWLLDIRKWFKRLNKRSNKITKDK